MEKDCARGVYIAGQNDSKPDTVTLVYLSAARQTCQIEDDIIRINVTGKRNLLLGNRKIATDVNDELVAGSSGNECPRVRVGCAAEPTISMT